LLTDASYSSNFVVVKLLQKPQLEGFSMPFRKLTQRRLQKTVVELEA
jgi:hypothetical protein